MLLLPYSHALLDICGGYTLPEVDDELGDLLDVDDIFALLRVLFIGDDLGAAGDL